MSRRHSPRPLPEPVRPVPPPQHEKGSLRSKRRRVEMAETARWWRQRDNEAKRGR